MPSFEIMLEMVGKPFVFPVLVALAVWALLAAPGFKGIRHRPGIHGWAGAIALGIALLVGMVASRNIRAFWPGSWIDWVPTLLGIAFAVLAWLAMAIPWLPRRWRTLAIGDLAGIGTLIVVWPIAVRYGNAQGWSGLAIAGFIASAAIIAGAIALVIVCIDPTRAAGGPTGSQPLAASTPGIVAARGRHTSGSPSGTALRIPGALIPTGLIGAILGMGAAAVFSWGAPSTGTNIATLGLLVGVFGLLALPPFRFTGAVRLRWLAPIIATAGVGLAAAALVSAANPIPLASPLLLAFGALSPLLLRHRRLDPSRGWRSGIAGLICVLLLAGACTLGSIAFAERWIGLPGESQTDADEGEDDDGDEWGQMYESWTPGGG